MCLEPFATQSEVVLFGEMHFFGQICGMRRKESHHHDAKERLLKSHVRTKQSRFKPAHTTHGLLMRVDSLCGSHYDVLCGGATPMAAAKDRPYLLLAGYFHTLHNVLLGDSRTTYAPFEVVQGQNVGYGEGKMGKFY